MADVTSYTDELLSSESRYKMNLNIVNYQGINMYDVPYLVESDPTSGDEYLSVTSEYENRLDRVANEYYLSSKYWWLVAQVNKVDNPFDVGIDTLLRITDLSHLVLEGVIT